MAVALFPAARLRLRGSASSICHCSRARFLSLCYVVGSLVYVAVVGSLAYQLHPRRPHDPAISLALRADRALHLAADRAASGRCTRRAALRRQTSPCRRALALARFAANLRPDFSPRQRRGRRVMKKTAVGRHRARCLVGARAAPRIAQVKFGVAGPITGPNAAFGAQLKNGAETGGRGHQRRRRHPRPEDRALARRRRLRSQAGRFGRQQVRRRRRQACGRPLQLRRVDPGLGRLRRRTASSRSRLPPPTRASPSATCGTPSAPAAATTSRARSPATTSPRTSRARRSPSSTTRPPTAKASPTRPRRRMNAKGVKEVLYEGINTGEKDFSALVSKLKSAGRRPRLLRRPAHGSRPASCARCATRASTRR